VCCTEWARSVPEKPSHCVNTNCGAHQVLSVAARVGPGIAAPLLREVDGMLRAYVGDVEEIVAIFADDVGGNEPHDTERPPPPFSEAEANTFEPTVTVLKDAEETETKGAER
jgi:hypothetical protein